MATAIRPWNSVVEFWSDLIKAEILNELKSSSATAYMYIVCSFLFLLANNLNSTWREGKKPVKSFLVERFNLILNNDISSVLFCFHLHLVCSGPNELMSLQTWCSFFFCLVLIIKPVSWSPFCLSFFFTSQPGHTSFWQVPPATTLFISRNCSSSSSATVLKPQFHSHTLPGCSSPAHAKLCLPPTCLCSGCPGPASVPGFLPCPFPTLLAFDLFLALQSWYTDLSSVPAPSFCHVWDPVLQPGPDLPFFLSHQPSATFREFLPPAHLISIKTAVDSLTVSHLSPCLNPDNQSGTVI